MKVLNIHERIIQQPKEKLAPLLATLASPQDKMFPREQWPAMRFKKGLVVGAKGGHGPIRYKVKNIEAERLIEFEFTRPRGFKGIHKFELLAVDAESTQLKHTIAMETSGWATFQWIAAIRPLHDALIEDALDKVENQFSSQKKRTEWSLWVKILRKVWR